MNTVVAQVSLFAAKANQPRVPLTVQIGTPFQVGTDPEEWACPLSMAPLFKNLHGAHGSDSYQALCMAVSLSQYWLRCFVEGGGTLSHDGGTVFPLDAYSFTTPQKS